MKKSTLQTLLAIVLFPLGLCAQSQYGTRLSEGFENGIPQEWTQENVRGSQNWVVEQGDGLSYPSGAFGGDKRVALRNESDMTLGYVSRLVTPQINLKGLYRPILCFSFANDQWTGDCDTLKIYYRTSADKDWTLLKTYDTYHAAWNRETVELNATETETYQIAFEGRDNMGRGIVVDDIEVRSTPNCTRPSGMNVSYIANDSVNFCWRGGFDTEKFAVKIATDEIAPELLYDEEVRTEIADSIIEGASSGCFGVSGLEAGKKYYAYIKSICEVGESEWSDVFVFETTNRTTVPYNYNFNMDLVSGYYATPKGWQCYSSTDKKQVYVNTAMSQYSIGQWSQDHSTVLFFGTEAPNPQAVPAEEWAYAVTPEIMGIDLNRLQVSFWSVNPDYAVAEHRIIVGVMTVPEDKSSFEPIDTVYINGYKLFVQNTVFLNEYKGDGRYVAFMTDFKTPNMFALDNLQITEIPECPVPSQLAVSVASADECTLDWESAAVDKADIVFSETALESITDDEITFKGVKKPYTAENLKPSTSYNVYLRSVNGQKSGEWSNAYTVVTPGRITEMPKTYGFENLDGITSRQNHTQSLTTEIQRGTTDSWLKIAITQNERYTVAVFPEIDDIKGKQVSFYTKVFNPSYENGSIQAGIITDINNVNTFTPLSSYTVDSDEEQRHLVRFSDYKGNGRFFALKAQMSENKRLTVYVDDVKFEEIPVCIEPENIKVEPGVTNAGFSWEAGASVSNWRFVLSKTQFSYNDMESGKDIDFEVDSVIKEMPFTINNLEQNETEYWYSLQFVCGEEKGQWTEPQMFVTKCGGKESLPYQMTFEGYKYGSQDKFAVPCVGTQVVGAKNNRYPRIEANSYYAHSGQQALALASSSGHPQNPDYSSYIALPTMNEDKVADLVLSLWVKSNMSSTEMEIGVMGDPHDPTTYDSLTTVKNINSQWQEFIVPLVDYKGEKQHIAIKTPDGTSTTLYVDDIEVISRGECPDIYNVECTFSTDTSAHISWEKGDIDKEWQLVITSKTLTNEELEAALSASATSEIPFAENVHSNDFEVKNLADNTRYYAYVRTVCNAGAYGQWCRKPAELRTLCRLKKVEELGVENFDTYGAGTGIAPGCWTIGSFMDRPSQYNMPYCDKEYSHGSVDGASLKFNTVPATNGSYAVSPKIDIDDIRRIQVSFWGTCGTRTSSPKYQRQLQVGVLTDLNDVTSFVPVDTITGYEQEQYYTVSLADCKADYNGVFGKYVMFLSEFGKENTFFVDDVRFEYIPDCPAPRNIRVDDVSENSITVVWKNDVTNSFKIRYATRALTDDELAATDGEDFVTENVTSQQVTLKGLSESVEYFIYIASVCGEELMWGPAIRVTTECHPIHSLPIEEDFDSYSVVGEFFNPICWTSYYNVMNQETKHPHLAQNGKNGNCLYVCEEGASAASYAISPAISIDDIAKCQVQFYAKNAPYNHQQRSIIVGVVSDISSGENIMNTFVPVDTILQVQAQANEFTHHIVSLESYRGSGKYVAFTTSRDLNLNASTNSVAGMYIDDIVIERIPLCQRPTDVRNIGVNDTSATVSFIELGGSTVWEAVVGKRGFDVTAATEITRAMEKNIIVKGLEPSTEYDIYVRSVCGEANYSEWSGPVQITTLPEPVSSYPYNNSFENEEENAKWNFLNGNQKNAWYIGSAISRNDGGKSLYISNNNGQDASYTKNTNSMSWAMRGFRLKTGLYTFNFDWTSKGAYTTTYMRAGLLPSDAMMAAGSASLMLGDGKSVQFNPYQSGTPAEWLALEGSDASGGQLYKLGDIVYGEEKNWGHNTVTMLITDEMAGDYNFTVYWCDGYEYGSSQFTPSAVIDNIDVEYNACVYPINLQLTALSQNEAVFAWEKVGGNATGWEIYVTSNADIASPDDAQPADLVKRDFTEELSYSLKELKPWTGYYIYVRAVCGEMKYSDWSEPMFVRSECEAQPANTVMTFDGADDFYYGLEDKHKIPICFVSGNESLGELTASNFENFPRRVENSTSNRYSRSGDCALALITKMKNETGGYMAFPEIEGKLDTMQITFWMRSGFSNQDGVMQVYRGNEVSVGMMDDVYNPATYQEIKLVKYPKTIAYGSNVADDKDQYWVKVSVPLTGIGNRRVVLKSIGNGANEYSKNNEVYIDDVVFEAISVCATPYDMEVTDVTATGAKVSFSHYEGTSWKYHVAGTPEMTDTVFTDTVAENSFVLSELEPGTRYYVSVCQLCEDGVSEWSVASEIHTDFAVKFTETFDNGNSRCPDRWLRSSQKLDYIQNGNELKYDNDMLNDGWGCSDSKVFKSRHMVMKSKLNYFEDFSVSAISSNWLVSPIVDLNGEQGAILSFDIALTAWDSQDSIRSTMKGSLGNKFIVLVSEVGVDTWDSVAVWSNDGKGDYVFDDIAVTGDFVQVDLTEYIGRRIQVAFYAQALGSNLEADFHLDNIVINGIVRKPHTVQLCQTEDYMFKLFTVRGSSLIVGENTAEYLEITDADGRDTLHTFNLDVRPMVVTSLVAEICENNHYVDNGFNASASGVYKRKLPATNGCDSVVILELAVVPAERTYIFDTICRGGSLIWNGEEIKKGGIYYDTVQSVRTHCDSILILNLSVRNALEYEVFDTVCFGQSYVFADKTLTESCRVQHKFTSSENCDSVVNLNLTVLPDLTQTIEAVICKGEKYTDNGFVGVDETGIHILPLTDSHGCDMTKTLKLVVLDPDKTVDVKFEIKRDDLPFEYFGKVFDENTPDGVYVEELDLKAENCSGKVRLTLTIGEPKEDALYMLDVKQLILSPNPVEAGGVVYANFELANYSQVLVELFDAAGQCVDRFTPDSSRIVITAPHTQGVYLVRITCGDGSIYIGRIMVS